MKEITQKLEGKINRLTNKTFKFDERIKEGWFSAVYFLKTKEIAENKLPDNYVTMQFFQKENAVLCGTDEAIALLHTFAENPETLEIHSLKDGDRIGPYESVLTVSGAYQQFGFLEGIIDGILGRRTSVATNVYNVVKAARTSGKQKPVIFMGDRDDHYTQQAGDGYAAFIGGSTAQATHAMNEWWGKKGMGTMPHALIQMFRGDIVAASKAYHEMYPEDDLVALVDYNNDVITDSLKVAHEFGKDLQAVRIDTSRTLVDKYFLRNHHLMGTFDPRGVNPELTFALRKALDDEGFSHVRIMLSGGFTESRITHFEKLGVPVDMYGVGGSLLKINIGFTGDNVLLNGSPEAKEGRRFRPNPRLEKVTMNQAD
ncbi:nicotinate phosphoribosyltransferase [Virgibacillus halodenitrificans]|uniref:nicotinate phosphoribosyltransferase n=1 Tax=Virgibacillus halodenitrificans TaxID=1482 RepID=A0AAC9IZE7_VIRHA|nr:nicotinate phosphoribosyltransferase [Virgibacillus halodenitrificans]APC47989.1 nicotinate phosphoribosyltransferase [Virgibacillus halodenitrificans]MCG1027756.1 nicotinate phosphoribosyltransferase [Virgibacillus halodenitrificans]MCJ0931790.1 nicotinate phosphoribosyltransferase [Virgibacillus halodenitrificans]MEC2159811.1 nicotinate phosphoribosyltransferase [Virgibacillus halodenitrificans]CDQ37035.1 Nicotinate phosphoribosyltransferase pncB2 [Virgibacillus halodenitrificans]